MKNHFQKKTVQTQLFRKCIISTFTFFLFLTHVNAHELENIIIGNEPPVDNTLFITRWDLSKEVIDNRINFNIRKSGPVNYTWQEVTSGTGLSGSGTFSDNISAVSITGLPAGAIIDVSIDPANLKQFDVLNLGYDRFKIIDVKQWGTTAWISMKQAFYGCKNLNISATDMPDLSAVSDMAGMFGGCNSLNSPTNIGLWNVANVTDMSGLFSSASVFNQNIGTWNVGNVIDMSNMFSTDTTFNQNIGSWNVAKVIDMRRMFDEASAFNQNISSWIVTNVNDMNSMFYKASAFNQNIGSWNVGNVTDMYGMFYRAVVFNQNIGSWNVANVTNMRTMFFLASAFNQNIGSWNVANVTDMYNMFSQANLFNQSLASWAPKFNVAVNLEGFLSNCGMNIANYEETLLGFKTFAPPNRTMGASGMKYCDAFAERDTLVMPIAEGGRGWTITGDKKHCPTTTSLSSDLNPSFFSDSVTFSATVTPNIATGSVAFLDGTTNNIGWGTISNGVATFSTDILTVDTHSITAVYYGDAIYTASTSAAISQVVNKINTTTVVSSDDNPSLVGNSVTFTATISPDNIMYEGLASFTIDDVIVHEGMLGYGTYRYTTSTLSAGPHTISAKYLGNDYYVSSSSSEIIQVVNKVSTTTTLTSSNNPSIIEDDVTFTASVSPNNATGTVTFKDGSVILGTRNVTAGTATFLTYSLSGTTHSITATYDGDNKNAVSSSSPISQVVNKFETSTYVTSNLNPSIVGDNLTFTATVSPYIATGAVTFKNGTEILGTGTLNGSGIATFSTSTLTVATHSITAVYDGDASTLGSTSSPVSQIVNNINTRFITRWNLAEAGSGATQLNFEVSSYGEVKYSWESVPAGTSGSGTFTGFNSYTVTISGLPAGATIDLKIDPTNFNKIVLKNRIDKNRLIDIKNWGTTHWISMSDAFEGCENLNISATDIPDLSGVGSMSRMFKNCTSLNSPLNIGAWNVENVSNFIFMFYEASAFNQNIGGWNVGEVTSMSVMFYGASAFNQDISLWNVEKVSIMNFMFLGASAFNQSLANWGSKFNSSVSLNGFLDNSGMDIANYDATLAGFNTDGPTGLTMGATGLKYCAATTDRANLVLATSSGGKGWTISGDTQFCSTTTNLTSSLNPSKAGDNVTFTATVSPNSATGTVTFKSGTDTLGTGTLNVGEATFSTSVLPVETHSITATYDSDGYFTSSTSSIVLQEVNKANTNTVITSSLNPSKAGDNITFTAIVSPNTATGTVTFKDGTDILGTSTLSAGIATYSSTVLSLGTHEITSIYNGDASNFVSTSSAVSQFVYDVSAQFISRWDLSKSGSADVTGEAQLSLGVLTSGIVNYTWVSVPAGANGSGVFTGTTATITGLPSGATIDLSINPTNFQRIKMNYGLDRSRLIDVKQWGTTAWISMATAFNGCYNLNITASDSPNLTSVFDMTSMFSSCTNLNGPSNIGLWDVSNVTTMKAMFQGASAFNQVTSLWNVSNVTDMSNMFQEASSFDQDVSLWDVSNVTDMSNMFNFESVLFFPYPIAFNQSLASWGTKLNANVNLDSFLNYCAMNSENYDATLTGFNAGSVTGRTLGATDLNYCSSTAERDNLINNKGWTISGDVYSASCLINISPIIPIICPGTSIELTASGCTGSYTWSGGTTSQTGSTANFAPTTTTTYTVQCSTGGSETVEIAVATSSQTIVTDFKTGEHKVKATNSILSNRKIGDPTTITANDVTFESGGSVLLNPGFETYSNSNFKALIKQCPILD
jgi:surface protein